MVTVEIGGFQSPYYFADADARPCLLTVLIWRDLGGKT
jgi:hypothetical protein